MATPPSIRDLTLRFLERTEAESQLAAVAFSEVEPHEVAVAFRTEPRAAWMDAIRAAQPATAPAMPSDWGTLISRQPAATDLTFALGNYPQRVRDLNTLLQAKSFGELRQVKPESTNASAGLKNWAAQQVRKDAGSALLAAGVLRAAGDLDAAESMLKQLRGTISADMQTTFSNEEAALLWQRGDAQKAEAIWKSLPESAPVLFNRGVAALFQDRPQEAREAFRKAITLLPDGDAWHHLASLYLALAEMRG